MARKKNPVMESAWDAKGSVASARTGTSRFMGSYKWVIGFRVLIGGSWVVIGGV